MEFNLDTLETLLKTKELQLEDGVKLVCGEKIRPVLSYANGVTSIEFESPFVYIVLEKLGKINIFDIKRKINRIEIGPKTITLVIDSFPDITRDRNTNGS